MRDAVAIAALFLLQTAIFYIAGLFWWAAFFLSLGILLAVWEFYLWKTKGETLSEQFWKLWEENPKKAVLAFWSLTGLLLLLLIHLRGCGK